MNERSRAFWVGVVVLSSVLIGATMAVWFGQLGPRFRNGSYEIFINFDEAQGVGEGTPIRKSGVLIGRVSGVRLNADRTVTVTAQIDSQYSVYRDEEFVIMPDLLGDATIEVVRKKSDDDQTMLGGGASLHRVSLQQEPKPPEKVQPGETIRGLMQFAPGRTVANLEQRLAEVSQSVKTASDKFSRASDRLAAAADNVDQLLSANREQIDRAIKEANTALEEVGKFAAHANAMLGDETTRQQLRKSIEELPATLREIRGAAELVGTNLEHLEKFTRPLGEGGPERVENLDQAIARLNRLMGEGETFARALNNPNGTLGRLARDPELYLRVNNAVQTVEVLLQQLRPIVADLRVFSDKIARHPETLGVRGAVERRPGIK